MGMVEEALEYLNGVAEQLGLDEDETDGFIESSMARKGFKKVSSWAEPDPENAEGGGGGDFFARRKAQQQGQTRQVGGGQQRQKGGGGNWQYGG